ncbi:DUF11 domain-containing protein [Meiothermus sp. QL-1]|uniref:DUF11 domain-containing protein n=1 Tax=Meiothermus sp. QL-1 TaxID=2058095 RepID=UPI00131452E5|nr:DUF11 domain-containing protein [Meiothermus sp. QL-1]
MRFLVFLLLLPSLAWAQVVENQARGAFEGGSHSSNTVRTEVVDTNRLRLQKQQDVGERAEPETPVTYRLRVENHLGIALQDLVLEDPLAPELEFVAASDGGVYDPGTHRVRYSLGVLAPGQVREVRLVVRVKASAAEGSLVENRFTLQSRELATPLTSPPVRFRVQTTRLLLSKEVERKEVRVGDRLSYTLRLTTLGQPPQSITLEDLLPEGTQYIPGSAQLAYEGSPPTPAEPQIEGRRLRWAGLAPGRLALSYSLRITPSAPARLTNTAAARAFGQGGEVVAEASAAALTRVLLGVLAPPSLLQGRVYLDVNRDGKYQAGLDVPLPGARLLLANGAQTLTDAEGRYTFREVSPGVHEVFLDPLSAPFPPLPHPEALGEGWRHRVRVDGLTTTDFPLEAPRGLAQASRSTRLVFGPLTVEKRLLPLPSGVRVVLVLRTDEPLPDLTLTDPLPDGGSKTFHFELLKGEQTLTYDLPKGHLTDPEVRWRYP